MDIEVLTSYLKGGREGEGRLEPQEVGKVWECVCITQ